MQNSDFSTRIASLYGSQPSSVVLCVHNSDIMPRINILYRFQTSPVVLCMQNSVISSRNTSLRGSQTSSVVLCVQNNVISIRITGLNGSQPSLVVFAFKTATLGPESHVSMAPRPHLWFFPTQNSAFSTRIASLYWSLPPSVVLCIHNSDIMIRINSLSGSQTSPADLCIKKRHD